MAKANTRKQVKPASQQQQPTRSRNFFLLTYAPAEAVKQFVEARISDGFFEFASYITHNRDVISEYDVEEDPEKYTDDMIGQPKQDHIHILCVCRNATTLQALQNGLFRIQQRLGVDPIQNTLGSVATDTAACYRYEIHADHPYKAQYSAFERIVYGDDSKMLQVPTFPRQRAEKYSVMDVLNDMSNGFNTFQLVQKYDNFYLRNLRNIDELYDRIKKESGYVDTFDAVVAHMHEMDIDRREKLKEQAEMAKEIYSLQIRLKAALDVIVRFHAYADFKQQEIDTALSYTTLEEFAK